MLLAMQRRRYWYREYRSCARDQQPHYNFAIVATKPKFTIPEKKIAAAEGQLRAHDHPPLVQLASWQKPLRVLLWSI